MNRSHFAVFSRRSRAPALPLPTRLAVRSLTIIPLVLLLAASAFYFAALSHVLRGALAPVVAREVGIQIKHEIRLGGLAFRPGAVVFYHVAIANHQTFRDGGETGATAQRIVVHYNPLQMAFDPANAVHAIGDIDVYRPKALVERFSMTRFNFTDVVNVFAKKKHRPHARPFVGKVIIHDGILHFRDYLAPVGLGTRPANNTLAAVNAVVDCHSERIVYYDATGQGTDERLAQLHLAGDASRTAAGRFRLMGQTANADGAYWAAYFKAFPQARVTGGRADLDLSMDRLSSKPAPGLPVDLTGTVIVHQASVALLDPRVSRLPVRDVSGIADFTTNGVTLRGSGLAAEQPVTISGTAFDLQSHHPQLAFDVRSPLIDAHHVSRYLPQAQWPPGLVVSPAPMTAQVTGAADDPIVSIQTTVPRATYQGNVYTAIRGTGLYAGKVLRVPRADFRLNDAGQGAVRVAVDFRPANPTFNLGGQVAGVDMATLHLPPSTTGKPPALAGTAASSFIASGTTEAPNIVANVSVTHPQIARTHLVSAQGRFAYSRTAGLTLSRAVLEAPGGGILTASGTVPEDPHKGVNMTVSASGADLTRLLAPYSPIDIGGLAFAQAHITGPLADPQVSGKVQLFGGRYGRAAADVINGTVSGSADAVKLQDVVVQRFPTKVHLTGTIDQLKSKNPRLNIAARLSEGDLTEVLALAEEAAPNEAHAGKKSALRIASNLPALTGTIQGMFDITGRAQSPQVAGHAVVTDATVDAYRIKQLGADIGYTDHAVRVKNALLQTEDGATLSADGQFNLLTTHLGVVFAGSNIDLDLFDRLTRSYATIDGNVDVSGRVGGTLASPTAAATLTARDLSVEGQVFAPFTVSARYANGTLSKTGSPWLFVPHTSGDDTPAADYYIDTLRLTLPTAAKPNMKSAVLLAARIPPDAPEHIERLVDALRASRFAVTPTGQQLLAKIDSLPSAPQGTVWIPSIIVAGPLQAPAVMATVGGADLVFGENRIGTAAVNASFRGGSDPSGHLNVVTSELLVAGVPIQSVTTNADYAHRTIKVNRLDARSSEAYLHGEGTAALDGVISADIDASSIPLSLFNLFLTPSRRLSGQISALTVEASGQTRSPDLAASVELDNPAVTVTAPLIAPGAAPIQTKYALDSVRSGTITLLSPASGGAGKLLSVNDLAAFKSGRRVATLSGTLPVAFSSVAGGGLPSVPADQPLSATLQIADLSVLSLFSPNLIDPKRTGGTLSATIGYRAPTAGTEIASRLLGEVSVAGASVGIVGIDTSLVNINGRATVQSGSVTIPGLTAQSSKGGSIAVSGSGTLAGDGKADFRVIARALRLDETSRQNILAKTYNSAARGLIDGEAIIAGPWRSPLIATVPGRPLVVSDAIATLPTASAGAANPAPTPPVDPRFAVSIALGANGKPIGVRSSLLRAEASGNVELNGKLSAPQLRAHLTVAQGQFILPPATLLKIVRPESGATNVVNAAYPRPSTDPADNGAPTLETRVDLTTQATVTVSQAQISAGAPAVASAIGEAVPDVTASVDQTFSGSGSDRYTITAHIYGLLNAPDRLTIDLSSSPPGLSRPVMLAALVPTGALQNLLGGGTGAEAAVKNEVAEAFSSIAVPELLSPLEESVAGALGLEDFSVSYSPDVPVNVTLTKQVAPRLYVTYIRSIGSRTQGTVNQVLTPPEYILKLGYGITRRLQFTVSTDDQRDNTVALESVFGF